MERFIVANNKSYKVYENDSFHNHTKDRRIQFAKDIFEFVLNNQSIDWYDAYLIIGELFDEHLTEVIDMQSAFYKKECT